MYNPARCTIQLPVFSCFCPSVGSKRDNRPCVMRTPPRGWLYRVHSRVTFQAVQSCDCRHVLAITRNYVSEEQELFMCQGHDRISPPTRTTVFLISSMNFEIFEHWFVMDSLIPTPCTRYLRAPRLAPTCRFNSWSCNLSFDSSRAPAGNQP